MIDQSPTPSRLTPPGRDGRQAAVAVAVLVVAFVGVALVKPWGGSVATPFPTGGTPAAVVATSAPPQTSAPPLRTAPPGPVAGAFTIPGPGTDQAAWSGVDWRRLALDDPLSLVRSVVSWRDGFIALGRDTNGGATTTPMWTSQDGSTWEPVPFGTGSTFWPGSAVVGVAEVPDGLVAITESVGGSCVGTSCPSPDSASIVPWTSPDGRSWTPHPAGALGQAIPPGATQMVLTAGPVGVVAAANDAAAIAAISRDGITWEALPDRAFPAQFVINDLRSTPSGYVAAGLLVIGEGRWDATTLWSTDGRAWSPSPSLPAASRPSVVLAASTYTMSAVTTLVGGGEGLMAIGREIVTPGRTLWWQSSDGRRWRAVPTYDPLGPTTCGGEGCGLEANGTVIGDGTHIVAVRGGSDAAAWTSTDGRAWQPLHVTGELPPEEALQAALLPGGILLSDGTATWFGEMRH